MWYLVCKNFIFILSEYDEVKERSNKKSKNIFILSEYDEAKERSKQMSKRKKNDRKHGFTHFKYRKDRN